MLSSHAVFGRRLPILCWTIAALAFSSSTARAGGLNCSEPGQNSPAFPVPEFRDGSRLWLDDFQPALPGQRIPLERDSTDYLSIHPPSFSTGHELFMGVDIVGDRLFVLYNVGIQVWDISGPFADSPKRIHFLDGVRGDWLHSDGQGESDSHLTYMVAVQDPNDTDQVLIAISGRFPMGVSLFNYRRSTNQLRQLYQHLTLESEQVQLRTIDGRVYGLFASQNGAFVLDVTLAAELPSPCLIDQSSNPCPDVFLGRIGVQNGSQPRGRYLDVLQLAGSWYLASSFGGSVPSVSPPEIWRFDVQNLNAAVRLYRGTERNSHAVTFLRRNDQTFLALRENFALKIHRVDSCLDGDGCATLPAAIYQENLGSISWPTSTLTYSESHGTPFLYYGVVGGGVAGTTVERLLDLTHLGGTNQLKEITAAGETYSDPCNGSSIGYWADYYAKNSYGYRNFLPRQGKFNGASHFYRATIATLDVHIRTPSDVLFADGFEFGTTGAWIASPP